MRIRTPSIFYETCACAFLFIQQAPGITSFCIDLDIGYNCERSEHPGSTVWRVFFAGNKFRE